MIVCTDASLIIKCLTYEPDSDRALRWLDDHRHYEMVAPSFFCAEVASVLRQKARRDELTVEDGQEALESLDNMKIRLVYEPAVVQRAYDLATALDQPTIYDTLYLAVAELEDCNLWTADARFARIASPHYPFVRRL